MFRFSSGSPAGSKHDTRDTARMMMVRLWFLLWIALVLCQAAMDATLLSPFNVYRELCANGKITQLVDLTRRATCEDFLLHEVIPYPLSHKLYAGAKYRRLSSNLVRAVQSGVLRVGVLGGSVSLSWVSPFKELATSLFAHIGSNFNGTADKPGTLVQVMNGAIGGTGALVPSGCAVSLLGETNLDVIVLEFALNDNNQTSLQTLVNILQRKYVNAAIVILELTSSLHKDVLQLPDGWAAGKDIAREFHLPYVNWSQAVDRGYNTTFNLKALWVPRAQHPKLLGNYWMAMSVVETLETIYRHRITVNNGSESVLTPAELSDYHPRVSHPDTLCISEFCLGGEPRDLQSSATAAARKRTHFAPHVISHGCWKRRNFLHSENATCDRYVRQYNASDCGKKNSAASSHFRLNVTVKHTCQLYVAVVGGGVASSLQCNMDVFSNTVSGKRIALLGQIRAPNLNFIAQTTVAVSQLRPGQHLFSLVPVEVPGKSGKEDVCNLSSIFCVPFWAKNGDA